MSNFELVSELINFEIYCFDFESHLINYFRNSNFEYDSELVNFEIFRLRIVPIFPLIRCLRRNNPSNRPHRLGGLSARSAERKISMFTSISSEHLSLSARSAERKVSLFAENHGFFESVSPDLNT